MDGERTFELTLERIALIRRMVVAWTGNEAGAPTIHPDAPYGSTDRDGDIANVTGDDEGAQEEHRAMGDALAVFLGNATLKPGRYQYHNPLAKLRSSDVSDVFRDDATGETPEHITFEVTQGHLAVLQRLTVEWDDGSDVPRIDPESPSRLTRDAPEAARPPANREMQPALQIFLRYADLGPGFFRQPDGTTAWEPA